MTFEYRSDESTTAHYSKARQAIKSEYSSPVIDPTPSLSVHRKRTLSAESAAAGSGPEEKTGRPQRNS